MWGGGGAARLPLMDEDQPQVARPLRAYQAEAIEALRESLRSGHRRPIMQAATGAGKTRCASEIVNLALGKGKRVVFVVPALSLIDQTLEAFGKDGITDIGIIQASHHLTNWSLPVQIATVQTLARRPVRPNADIVIVDEAHVRFKNLEEWMKEPGFEKVPFIGLSATPWTKGLGTVYDDLIIAATTKELIEAGTLSPFRVFAPSHPNLTGIKSVAGDYHEGQLSERMSESKLVADIVDTWIRLGEGRPTLCFAVDRAHAKHIQQQFIAAGIACGYQDAHTDAFERRIIREKFHKREFPVVVNIDTLTVGVDWDVRCIILARPTKSEMKFVQIIGRGLRTAEGKQDLTVLDHSDNHIRLGMVTDIHHDTLDDGTKSHKEAAKPPLPKECPKCHYLRPPKVSICPACGFKPEPKSKVEVEDGELVELTKTQRKRVKAGVIELQGREIPLGEFYGQLRYQARMKGYKPGWPDQKYRSAVGVWPNAHKHAEEVPPCYEVASWIKAQQIRWVKRRARLT